MKLSLSLLSLAPLASMVSAHFVLHYPTSRGSDEGTMGEFPCGGFSASSNRTQISLSSPSFPVALTMGHDLTVVEFLLAIGTNPGDNYNVTLKHTFQVEGMGAFCVPDVLLSEAVLGTKLVDGMNLTLQVQTNADPNGGLYSCADLQLTSTSVESPSASTCANNTGVTAVAFSGAAAQRNANVSTPEGGSQSGSSGSSSTTTASTSTSTSTGAASAMQTAGWGMLGAAVLGGLAAL
ncbi:hypothetical protein P175DRAFT_0443152 [Aspergillus ochraceoroseus IBT 24754]|uniref:Copper acquisition factor BIM1-like domain-containing protein n=3 Tax=Aspergillus subgen. Nidulantes TaxID=2720870 RepID=A0A0F8USR0_9EURO|nr:uncharacterized protein P175DRAFT_0443152 [Aspergillus ochraceoroseus IBT 24754]KKK13881.1 hypothetical protein ARAM_004232 [Aspergillus rambellii]KKK15043.1 hypothetical protein AOCH_002124 [Aspergillus ochraceoroseus]PTU18867.1 hypothetical protein P175DRAFT_0443152 [Aspergillus ochraceoroseus IBT 24754]